MTKEKVSAKITALFLNAYNENNRLKSKDFKFKYHVTGEYDSSRYWVIRAAGIAIVSDGSIQAFKPGRRFWWWDNSIDIFHEISGWLPGDDWESIVLPLIGELGQQLENVRAKFIKEITDAVFVKRN